MLRVDSHGGLVDRHRGFGPTVRPALPHLGNELRKFYASIISDEVPTPLAGLVQKLTRASATERTGSASL